MDTSQLPDRTVRRQPTFADPENPTYEECVQQGFQHLRPGKQCPHPANAWFRDPRPSPPPLRSRHAILTDIFRDNTTFNARCRDILSHYIPADDPDVLARDALIAQNAPCFPNFSLLPTEIREQIWQLAIPSRILDVREVLHGGFYIGIRNVALPVPIIAFVCREARDVVLRLGVRLKISSQDPWPPGGGLVRAGFFVRGSDVPLYLADPRSGDGPVLQKREIVPLSGVDEDDVTVEEWTVTTLNIPSALQCETAAVSWFGPATMPLVARRNDRAPLSSEMIRDTPHILSFWPWSSLKKVNASLSKIYIAYRSRYIDVSLRVARDFSSLRSGTEGDDLLPRRDVELQLLVDIYDDQRLAELSSLETLFADGKNNKPRYASPGARNPGRCLGCERVHWEQNVRPIVVSQWLQLFEEELDDDMVSAVFPGKPVRSPAFPDAAACYQYDPEHPWVKEKLRTGPELRPTVLVTLQVAEEGLLRGDFDEEWDFQQDQWSFAE